MTQIRRPRLPPNLPEEIFWQSVQAWVTDEAVTWKSYETEGIPSRAFKSEAQLVTSSRAYDGHVFRVKVCNESHALMEYAPFQKVPTEKIKIDARNNTINKDEDYISFLEMLKGGAKTESVSLKALIAASQPLPSPTTTPLLEALKAEKSAQKDKETILRNHAHYKDPAVSGSSSKEMPRRLPSRPLELHGRSHSGKGDVSSAPAPASTSAGSGLGQAPPPAVTTESAPAGSPAGGPAPAPAPGQRKNRPIGFERQFEAVLNGAGVAGGESGAWPDAGTGRGSTESSGPGKAGKQKHREERSRPPEVVPNILQRPAETASPDVVIMQRPQSPRGAEGLVVHGEGGASGPSGGGAGPTGGSGAGGGGRGITRRGRGRGSVGHRGG
ncbi:Smg-4/UPF3 family domain containing protein [Tylopilus felleus]